MNALPAPNVPLRCTVGGRTLEELSQVLSTEDEMAMTPSRVKVPETLMHTSEGKLVVNYKVRAIYCL